jgi:hypothetical protein
MMGISRREFLMMAGLSMAVGAALHRAAPASPDHTWTALADAPIRQWAAAAAPLIARASRGQTGIILDRIETEGGTWLAVADAAGDIIGWSPAGAWRHGG